MHTFRLVGGILILILVKKLFENRNAAGANGKSDAASSSVTQGDDSSSSSFPSSGRDYEVFLSFRGKDTRTNFTDHLYNALVDRGIDTFRDNEGLHIGENIDQALRSAIHQSKIAIPIFSKDYASSKWCLRELAEIVECMNQQGQRKITVMPVFYHVDPSEVRHQTGCYEKAFQNHQKKFGQETEGWKKALKQVAELKGWDLKNIAIGHDKKLIQLIVKEVRNELRSGPWIVSDNLVGIHSHVVKMTKLLNVGSNDVRIVGIHGLGGIGKTTIARCVYNTIYHHFEGCSFLLDTRETFQTRGPIHLQCQLLINILNLENPNITSVDQGSSMIQQRLSNKKVLIVVDDVDQNIILNSIIGKRDWFGIGSKIIITTRDKDILDVLQVDSIYEPNEMDLDHSLRLFSKHAFNMDQPPAEYLDLSKDVIKTAGGLPLALEVLGSSLVGKGELAWRDTVKKLKKIPNHKVSRKLGISYDGLDHVEKEMFLDIACFFIGMDKDIACYIWDGCGFLPDQGIEVLCKKSLVKIGKNNELRMHDQLRDLGREIVRQENYANPGERSRLWFQPDVLDVLSTQRGTEKVGGLCVDFSEQNNQSLMSEGFTAMTNLRLLKLDYASVSGNFTHPFSEVRWLSWKGCYCIQFPLTNPRKLVVLDLSSGNVTESWRGWSYIKGAKNLKVLDLSYSYELSQTPNLLENLKLEKLILHHCRNLAMIDNSIGHLKRLVVLNMKYCKSLEKLPTSICELISLKRLDIRGCEKISQLPEKLGRLEALMELLIDYTPIERLPNSIGDLRNLKTLSAACCKIQEGGIPNDIDRLSSLEILILEGNQFRTLPAAVCRLSSLQKFSLESCGRLQSLPQLSNLTNLGNLCLDSCESLMELPITMNAVTRLESLSLKRCTALQCISHLPLGLTWLAIEHCENVREIGSLEGLDSLQTFRIESCNSLKKFSNLRGLRNLESLSFIKCPKLEEIESPEELDSLQTFWIESCDSLKKFSNLSGLRNLESFSFIKCPKLEEIESPEELDSLQTFRIESCDSLRKFPNLRGLRNFKSFSFIKCPKLEEIESPKELDSLQTFWIESCDSLKKFPNLRGLRNLESFSFIKCSKLEEIESLEELDSLQTFRIESCDSLRKFPNLRGLRNFKSFSFIKCPKLEEIESLEELDSLQTFLIESCDSLKKFLNLRGLRNLESFSFIKCPKLEEIESLQELDSLQAFQIESCDSLRKFPNLRASRNFKSFSFIKCPKLEEIKILGELDSLQTVRIESCDSLKKFPNLKGLRNLESFSFIKCPKLEEIESLEELDSLEAFQIESCDSLRKIPNLRDLKKLRNLILDNVGLAEIEGLEELHSLEKLKLEGCHSLKKIQLPQKLRRLYIGCKLAEIKGLAGLESLEEIEIIDTPSELLDVSTLKNLKHLRLCRCNCMERLPKLSNLNKLKELRIEKCGKLIEVPSVDRLEALEILQVYSCESLEIFPDLSNLTELRTLRIVDCQKLTEIEGLGDLESLEETEIIDTSSVLPDVSTLIRHVFVNTTNYGLRMWEVN